MRAPRTNCQYHCTGCGSHLSSLAAFDAHRRGEPDERRCDTEAANPAGEALLVPKTENGTCSLTRPPVMGGATVWATRDWWRASAAFDR